jgi:hypothetical protein
MQSRDTPISVWHGQPFELPVLDREGQWAIVLYRNPKNKPRHFSFLHNLFLVRNGESFSAVGNVDCSDIRVWKMTGLFSWPRKRTLQLAVRRLDKKPMPDVYTPTLEPRLSSVIAADIQRVVLSASQMKVTSIVVPELPSIIVQPFNLQLNIPTDEPELKGFDSSQ